MVKETNIQDLIKKLTIMVVDEDSLGFDKCVSDIDTLEKTITKLGEYQAMQERVEDSEALKKVLDKAREDKNVPWYGHHKGDWVSLSEEESIQAIQKYTRGEEL